MAKKKSKPKTLKGFVTSGPGITSVTHLDELYLKSSDKESVQDWKENCDPYEGEEGIVYQVTLTPIKRVKIGLTQEKL